MRYILLCCSLFIFIDSQAQQINPVPDYVFQNRMSVGRTAVTDTAAYFSVGPRYGAIRGFMPPMVIDTANVSGNKRNGLLIFSIQKNKYVYWDSVGSKWAEMAGTAGTALTSADTANLLSTRAWRKKGDDSLGALIALKVNISDTASMLSPYTRGSGTTNYLPKFTGTRTLGNSVAYDNGGTELLVNTTGDSGAYALQVNGKLFSNQSLYLSGNNAWELSAVASAQLELIKRSGTPQVRLAIFDTARNIAFGNLTNATGSNAALYVNGNGNEVYVNSITDAGAYTLQIAGNIYNTTGAVFAVNSGDVGIATTSPAYKLDVSGTFRTTGSTYLGTTSSETYINTTTDAGAYTLQVSGNIYNTTGALLAANSGSVGIGGTNANYKMYVAGTQYILANDTLASSLSVSGQPDIPDFSNAGGGYLSLRDRNAAGYGNMQIGAYINDPYGMYIQVNNGTSGQPLLLNPRGGEIYINSLSDAGAYALQVAGSIYNTTGAVFAASSGELLIATTTDAGDYKLQVAGAIYNTTTITTGAPTSGTAKPWRLGEAATVSPTSPNRTIRVEIDGTVYYIHAKTTND